MATGCLSAPNLPDFAGHSSFEGPTYLTGRWPHEEVDFTGKRVAVIGTGSSAIQSIPIIARQAAHLYVFQRTRELLDPGAQPAARTRGRGARSRPTTPACAHAHGGPLGRRLPLPPAVGARGNARGAAARVRGAVAAGRARLHGRLRRSACSSHEANATAAEFVRAKIRTIVRDPAVAAEAVARQHHRLPSACASIPATTRPSTAPTSRWSTSARCRPCEITPEGVRAHGRTYAVDAIVFATGFDAMTGALLQDRHPRPRRRARCAINGQTARAPIWACRSPGFPNLFTITGPGQPVGADQHAAVDRAARELDRRLPRPSARPRPRVHRGQSARPRMPGWRTSNEAAERLDQRRHRLLVPRRQHRRQAARVHALSRRRSGLPQEMQRGRRQRLRRILR